MNQQVIILIISYIIIASQSCENFLSAPEDTKQFPDYSGQIDTIFDMDGNAYRTVGIGSQIWMGENLRTEKLNDGTLIQEVVSDSIWDFNPQPAFCWYNNDSIYNKNIYGALYNYYSVNSGLLCPVGWHVPRDSEWAILARYLGGPEKAGGKLKDYYSSYWKDPNNCYLNDFNFLALPGGNRSSYLGRFRNLGYEGQWWTSSTKNDFIAYSRIIYYNNTNIVRHESGNGNGYSVRCIKDN